MITKAITFLKEALEELDDETQFEEEADLASVKINKAINILKECSESSSNYKKPHYEERPYKPNVKESTTGVDLSGFDAFTNQVDPDSFNWRNVVDTDSNVGINLMKMAESSSLSDSFGHIAE